MTGLPQKLHKTMGGSGDKGAVNFLNSMLFQPFIDAKRFGEAGHAGKALANVGVGALNLIPSLALAGITSRFVPGLASVPLKYLGLLTAKGKNSGLYNLGRTVAGAGKTSGRAVDKLAIGLSNRLGDVLGGRFGPKVQSAISKAFALSGTLGDPKKLGILRTGGLPGMALTVGASMGVPMLLTEPLRNKFSVENYANKAMAANKSRFDRQNAGSPLFESLMRMAEYNTDPTAAGLNTLPAIQGAASQQFGFPNPMTLPQGRTIY